MMSNGDYRAAIQKANTYRRAHPLNQHKDQRDYRELLKLQKTATEQLYKAQSPQTRSVRGISLPLDIAVIDNDLMTSYVRDDMSTWAREHFLSAEQGYMLCLTSAKSLERDGIEVTSARREIQWITESLCGLYETWAGYKRDLSFVQKAEQALRESQKFRAYSEDPGTVTTRFAELKTSLEKMRREFP